MIQILLKSPPPKKNPQNDKKQNKTMEMFQRKKIFEFIGISYFFI